MTIHYRLYLLAIFVVSIFLYSFVLADAPTVVISEIGAYEPSGLEWVEIVNVSSSSVDMEGWKFWENETNHGLTSVQGDFLLEAGEYAVITQDSDEFLSVYAITSTVFDSSWGTLNEGGEEIGLKNDSGVFVELFSYVPARDFSLQRRDLLLGDYLDTNWGEHVTSNSVGQKNLFEEEHETITVVPYISINTSSLFVGEDFLFSAASSSPREHIASFAWDFGDEHISSGITTTHSYEEPGMFAVRLIVVDVGGGTTSVSQTVEVREHENSEPSAEQIIISEVYPVAAVSSSEWVELFNPTESDIDLEGYVFEDAAGKRVALSGVVGVRDFFVVDFSQAILNNGGDVLTLRYGNTEIDQLLYGGVEGATVSVPNRDQSIVRRFSVDDSEIADHAFFLADMITKGQVNLFDDGEQEQEDAPTLEHDTEQEDAPHEQSRESDTVVYEGMIVINELVSDPADGAAEFVELYHKGVSAVDLTGWWIEEGSEARTNLSGEFSPGGFFVIEKPKGNLNNGGDVVSLYAPNGVLVDQVVYGSWDDGNRSNNADAPKDPLALVRKRDGADSNYDRHDFVVTDVVTPGASNVVSFPKKETNRFSSDKDNTEAYVFSGEIVINEVFPNPAGSDSEQEFVEIKNIGKSAIDLTGWKIGDATKKRYIVRDVQLPPGDVVSFLRVQTGLAFNNSGEEKVQLFSPHDVLVDVVEYAGSVAEGVSFVRDEDTQRFVWSTTATPGGENVVSREVLAPIIVIDAPQQAYVGDVVYMDGSDSYDPDGSVVTSSWTFLGEKVPGPTATWVFWEPGEQTYSYQVIDTEGVTTTQEFVIDVLPVETLFQGGYVAYAGVEDVIISEVFPNPVGSDDEEFVELFNPTNDVIDLSGMTLDDSEGGSRGYVFPEGTVLLPQSYVLFERETTSLAFNNSFDSVRLLYPDDEVARELHYDDVVEGAGLSFSQTGEYCWSIEVTPGRENVCVEREEQENKKAAKRKATKDAMPISLAAVRDADLGDFVRVRGIVSVLPGILSSQFFYITDPELGGVQVYMYKKDFPALSVGDLVEVIGEVRSSQGERRIKISEHADIAIVGQGHDVVPFLVDMQHIDETHDGWFLEVAGEVTEVKRSYMYVDDGTDELRIYFKKGTGISAQSVALGDLVTVRGILGRTKQGYQLLPRSREDIVKTGSVEPVVSSLVVERDGNLDAETAEKYLTATAGGLTSILFGLLIRARGAILFAWFRRMWLRIFRVRFN